MKTPVNPGACKEAMMLETEDEREPHIGGWILVGAADMNGLFAFLYHSQLSFCPAWSSSCSSEQREKWEKQA